LLKDALLNSMIVNALRLSHEFVDLVREGYTQYSFYGNKGECTKDSRIEAKTGYIFGVSIAFVSRGTLSCD
jgi:hypothetical protein